jgi:hypothetical protein
VGTSWTSALTNLRPYSLDLAPSDVLLFGPVKNQFGGNVSLMTKRLKRRCGSDWDNSQKTSMLRVSTPHW